MEFSLVCNYSECDKKLVKQAYVTSCSHIFCKEHGQYFLKSDKVNGKCIVCNAKLNDSYAWVSTDLEPSDKYKTMILSGLNPEQILDIVGRALSFYTYQMYFQTQCKENLLSSIRRNYEEKDSTLKAEIYKMQRLAENLKKDCSEKIKEIEFHKQKVFHLSRENKNLMAKIERFKHHRCDNGGSESSKNVLMFSDFKSPCSYSKTDYFTFGN